ncbi:MAG TPA: response regulator [Gemmatimonadaceae bacterium]|nr:response regulator [Gemmatimonadaceae bacterium]
MANHVLIVEDNELARDAWRMLLQATGRRVSVAGSVAETLLVARAERPDLVVLDLTLPDGEGLSVIPELLLEDNPPVFVALTGHDTREVADRCRAAGCATVLVKPVTSKELLATVDPLLADRG